jgi:hypothetical protein
VTVGLVKVLLVNVSLPARVANVPVVGSVNEVVPDTVSVVPKAPEIVSVLAELFATPVPPFAAPNVPVMSAVKDTAPKVGAPDAFPCNTVVVVPAAVVAKAVVVLAYVMPYCVKALD